MADEPNARGWVALPRFTGRAWVFMHNLAAETILPPAGRPLPPAGGRRHLFGDLDREIAGRIAEGDMLVGGENLGHGPGASAAVAALRAAAMSVVLARSFATDFAAAAFDVGIPALILDAPESIRTGHTVRVDIDGGRVVDLSSGDRFPIRDLTEDVLDRLRERLAVG
jgi:3-isopropylmalate/(R)-2-methylmalate dehydratase small subunit